MCWGYVYVKHFILYHFSNLCKQLRLNLTYKFICISFLCGLNILLQGHLFKNDPQTSFFYSNDVCTSQGYTNIDVQVTFKVCGCYLVHVSCSLASTNQIYLRRIVLHQKIYNEASTKRWIGKHTFLDKVTFIRSECLMTTKVNTHVHHTHVHS